MHVLALSEYISTSHITYLNDVFKTVRIYLPFAIHVFFLLDSWFRVPS